MDRAIRALPFGSFMQETIHQPRSASIWTYAHPGRLGASLWAQRDLILQLVQREIAARYKTTFFGLIWPLLMPLLMLCIYTFVFGQIFEARWDMANSPSLFEFSLTLYCGLIVFNVFSETVVSATTIIVINPNYVKKVVFPLEVLPIASLGVALFHFALSFCILLPGVIVFLKIHHFSMLLFPLAVLPVIPLTLGLAWATAALGVFVRDLATAMGFLVQVLLYGSPVFYPLTQVKDPYRVVLWFNPLTHIIEAGRRTLLWGRPPQWIPWSVTFGFTLLVMVGGYMLFMRSRRAFSDIV
jgi:lipopolysaccharide transport system permease protein